MATSLFRVKRYAHPKYKFVVRAKIAGKWKRRYFLDESEAIAFAEAENGRVGAAAPASPNGAAEERPVFARPLAAFGPAGGADLTALTAPTYLGPQIERYVGDSWSMHLPFAYDLMREVAPSVFVELGVKDGESYFTFCQSAVENKIDVKCYGVDSWRGDVQTGPLDPKVQEQVLDYNWRYSSFSELKPMFFHEALACFVDGCIDLLHIDGTHIYEDVKTDFESWLPKLSPNGIILFHDVVVRDRAFGVWKLWQEIAQHDNSFLFEFGYGLGVWKRQPVSVNDAPFIRRLLSASTLERREINHFYANAAAALALWQKSNSKNEEVHEELPEVAPQPPPIDEKPALNRRIAILERRVWAKSERISDLNRQIKADGERLARLRREGEAKSRAFVELEQERDKQRAEIGRLQTELAGLRAELTRERDATSQSIRALKRQLAQKDAALTRAEQDLKAAQWEPLTLRAAALRNAEFGEVASGRLLELENRAQAAESERDVLRQMVTGLQTDLESAQRGHQTRLSELQTLLESTQRDLAAANESVRKHRMQMERLRKNLSRKLILPFGRSQRQLAQLTTLKDNVAV